MRHFKSEDSEITYSKHWKKHAIIQETISRKTDFAWDTLSQKAVGSYTQSTERNMLSSKNLYPEKLPFKNEQEIKTLQDKQSETIHHQQTCPTRNTKGSSSGWNERTLDSMLNPHKEMKSTYKENYKGKHKIRYKCIFWL